MGFNNGYDSGWTDAENKYLPRIASLEKQIEEGGSGNTGFTAVELTPVDGTVHLVNNAVNRLTVSLTPSLVMTGTWCTWSNGTLVENQRANDTLQAPQLMYVPDGSVPGHYMWNFSEKGSGGAYNVGVIGDTTDVTLDEVLSTETLPVTATNRTSVSGNAAITNVTQIADDTYNLDMGPVDGHSVGSLIVTRSQWTEGDYAYGDNGFVFTLDAHTTWPPTTSETISVTGEIEESAYYIYRIDSLKFVPDPKVELPTGSGPVNLWFTATVGNTSSDVLAGTADRLPLDAIFDLPEGTQVLDGPNSTLVFPLNPMSMNVTNPSEFVFAIAESATPGAYHISITAPVTALSTSP